MRFRNNPDNYRDGMTLKTHLCPKADMQYLIIDFVIKCIIRD